QAELIVAKHRNGGLDNLRLKFIKELGRFENIDDFDSPYEFHSKMNAAANDDTFKPDPNQAFNLPDNSDLPF
ncbi:DnaB-like helicase C-terminal domain-containing protein, partial [Flavobacteriaceae bacterium]|nr:DnaB-like helicase C-terminal domain-containing protein [Flavobacteriaceae bacterium]